MSAVARAAAARVQSTVRSHFFGDTRALQHTRALLQRGRADIPIPRRVPPARSRVPRPIECVCAHNAV
ncbi:unnamed protein product [Trichogramma brassicae]|uniref:Uncharacterized protein n=1 Tax=Trichogramma brassicae TaxID=86971 RepID=A0A6H5IGJ7_9HYME|nr:unnamed protein product [Trichogramma brassicae]